MKSHQDMQRLILFLGPEKTGSTSLYDFFSKNFSIRIPRKNKELYFWDEYYNKSINWYLNQFEGQSHDSCLDFTPTYFGSELAFKRIIKSHIQDLTFVITLRHPVKRAYSHYLHLLKYGHEPKSFKECLRSNFQMIASNSYVDNLQKWSTVSKKSIKVYVLISEEIFSNQEFIQNFGINFLKLEALNETFFEFKKINSASITKYHMLSKHLTNLSKNLRALGIHAPTNIVKKLGMHNWLYSTNNIPTISDSERNYASKLLDSEIKLYEKLRQESSEGLVVL